MAGGGAGAQNKAHRDPMLFTTDPGAALAGVGSFNSQPYRNRSSAVAVPLAPAGIHSGPPDAELVTSTRTGAPCSDASSSDGEMRAINTRAGWGDSATVRRPPVAPGGRSPVARGCSTPTEERRTGQPSPPLPSVVDLMARVAELSSQNTKLHLEAQEWQLRSQELSSRLPTPDYASASHSREQLAGAEGCARTALMWAQREARSLIERLRDEAQPDLAQLQLLRRAGEHSVAVDGLHQPPPLPGAGAADAALKRQLCEARRTAEETQQRLSSASAEAARLRTEVSRLETELQARGNNSPRRGSAQSTGRPRRPSRQGSARGQLGVHGSPPSVLRRAPAEAIASPGRTSSADPLAMSASNWASTAGDPVSGRRPSADAAVPAALQRRPSADMGTRKGAVSTPGAAPRRLAQSLRTPREDGAGAPGGGPLLPSPAIAPRTPNVVRDETGSQALTSRIAALEHNQHQTLAAMGRQRRTPGSSPVRVRPRERLSGPSPAHPSRGTPLANGAPPREYSYGGAGRPPRPDSAVPRRYLSPASRASASPSRPLTTRGYGGAAVRSSSYGWQSVTGRHAASQDGSAAARRRPTDSSIPERRERLFANGGSSGSRRALPRAGTAARRSNSTPMPARGTVRHGHYPLSSSGSGGGGSGRARPVSRFDNLDSVLRSE
eukprot:TRINITY_DN3937_c0_g1_i3.p1 TRINITY_DN3937_c0_g1~~TRINITY_DN3937_c0_g1_i3.p1  ORF type:complete len:667 (+),score=80.22 TRINITY_DN3937_c0_g1_i3:81-2081(+)